MKHIHMVIVLLALLITSCGQSIASQLFIPNLPQDVIVQKDTMFDKTAHLYVLNFQNYTDQQIEQILKNDLTVKGWELECDRRINFDECPALIGYSESSNDLSKIYRKKTSFFHSGKIQIDYTYKLVYIWQFD